MARAARSRSLRALALGAARDKLHTSVLPCSPPPSRELVTTSRMESCASSLVLATPFDPATQPVATRLALGLSTPTRLQH